MKKVRFSRQRQKSKSLRMEYYFSLLNTDYIINFPVEYIGTFIYFILMKKTKIYLR